MFPKKSENTAALAQIQLLDQLINLTADQVRESFHEREEIEREDRLPEGESFGAEAAGEGGAGEAV